MPHVGDGEQRYARSETLKTRLPKMMYATPVEVEIMEEIIAYMFDLVGMAKDGMCDAEHTTSLDVHAILDVGRQLAIEAASLRAVAMAIEKAGHDAPPF